MQWLNDGVFEISKKTAEAILNSEKIKLLSYPARRVLYAGRATGRWYTKSENVHNEIMDLYATLQGVYSGRKGATKKSTTKTTQTLTQTATPTPKEVIEKLDHLLKLLTSYQQK